MKSLATLIKLQKTHVDEQRLQLAKLQAYVDTINQRIAALEIEKAREQVAAANNLAARQTYGAFLTGAAKRGHELEKELKAAMQAVELARDKLAELFEEQKRYELAEENRIKTETAEETRKETIILDEIGGVTFARNKERS